MTIALITARGGSTRTPRKNLATVCGLPLVAWTVRQATASRLVDGTWLTTDDDEIAAAGERYGARIVRRPVLDHGVTAGVVFLDALRKIEAAGVRPDTLVTLLPTSPLRRPGDLDRLVAAHREHGRPALFAVPQKETYIYRLEHHYQDRFATLPSRQFRARQLIGDKFWRFARLAGGDCCASRDWFVDTWRSNPELDIDIDSRPVDTETLWDFVPVEDWQAFEVDYPPDLELVRALFAHYLGSGA